MKIIKTQVLRGPNLWSNYRRNLIQVKLDLEEMENFPTDKLPGFTERFKNLLPTLVEHECSEGVRGGFFQRLERGTWMGHIIEHTALELQSLAGMETGFGRTKNTDTKGVYNMVFSYVIEEAGLYAAKAAFNLVDALSQNKDYNIEEDIQELRRLKRYYGLGPSTQNIVDAAIERNIPWSRQDSSSGIIFGHGINQKKIRATITGDTSSFGVEIAGDKEDTKQILLNARIPVSEGGVCSSEEELDDIICDIDYPIVIKPLDGNQGKGATINILNHADALKALGIAKEFSRSVIVEKYVSGFDYRVLVIGNKFVAASKRIPAHIKGDGQNTIEKLIEAVNADSKRGCGHESVLTQIKLDSDSYKLLAAHNYTLQSIPEAGKIVFLKSTANLSTGGTAIDVTDEIHPENIFMAERISKLIGLDICGIDIMSADISVPLKQNNGVVLEVNAAPGFRMHTHPVEGKSRNVGKAVMDMLYPEDKPARIPLIAITGTNGKTTTTRLTAHIAKLTGYNVGYTTTDGIYIGDYTIDEGDMTGPISAKVVLQDPTVEFAVLETARGGLIRSGLSFDYCDVGVITNIREDHLGLNDINTLGELANVKAVVARSVKETGWAILNAEDEECVKIAETLSCNVAFFALDKNNETIQRQINNGKAVAILENDYITIIKGNDRIRIENVSNIPVTMDGKCNFMIANVLASTLACYMWGFTALQIKDGLKTFIPSPEQTPGRINLFEFKDFKVIVDYAHNPHGLNALKEYLNYLPAERKIGIISGIGDRRSEDIIEFAEIAATMFDHIIIRQEHDLRGRTENEINELLIQGITKTGKNTTYNILNDELQSIKYALGIARKGDLIVALSDVYKKVIEVIKEKLEDEKNSISVSDITEIGTIAS